MAWNQAYREPEEMQPHQRTSGWQVIYTGFVLILLCFFVMLTSFASLQQSKITRFARAFSHAVSVFTGGRSLEKGDTAIDGDAMAVSREDRLARLFEKVRQLGNTARLDPVLVKRTRRGVVITLSENLLFASGDAQMTESAASLLDKVAWMIRQVAVPVEIEGHSDDRPIRTGRYPSNWELSTARAVTVLRYLVERRGIEGRRVTAVGFAQFRPVAPNDSPDNRARNRRVEIVFKPEGGHAS